MIRETRLMDDNMSFVIGKGLFIIGICPEIAAIEVSALAIAVRLLNDLCYAGGSQNRSNIVILLVASFT